MMNIEIEEPRDKVLAASVSKTLYNEVKELCKKKNWRVSRFVEKAIRKAMRDAESKKA